MIHKVKKHKKRNGTVVNEYKKRSGRPIEWGGVSVGEPDGPESTPQGTLVAWVTEHDETGYDLSADGDGGVLGVIYARRVTIGSVVRQYIAYWKRNIKWDAKNPPFGDEQDTTTRVLLVDIKRVQGDDLVSVPDTCYEVGIDWVDEEGVQMPRLVWLRKQ